MRRIVAASLTVLALGLLPAHACALPYPGSAWSWATPSPQGETLDSVAARDSLAFATSPHGPLVSRDGGASWTRSQLPADTKAVTLLGGGSLLAATGDCALLRSDDAGATSRRLLPPLEDNCVASISFPSAQVGYVARGGVLLRTDDGGRSFGARTAVPGTSRLLFTDAETGFALAGTQIAGEQIWRTADGARTWTPVASSPQGLSDITSAGGGTLVAVGRERTALRSDDGGITWSSLTLEGLPKADLLSVDCAGPDRCLAAMDAEAFADETFVIQLGGGGTQARGVPGSEGTRDLAFAGSAHVVAAGDRGLLLTSEDSGASFQARSTGTHEGYGRLLRGSGHTVFAIGTAAGRSDDDGRTWRRLPLPLAKGASVSSGSFADARQGAAITRSSSGWVVWSTDDGGGTWTRRAVGRKGGPGEIAALGTRRFLSAPRKGKGLSLSRDDGRTFHPVRSPAVRALRVLGLARRGPATAAWGHRVLLIGTEGRAWRRARLPRRTTIKDVEVVSRRMLVVTPTDGRLLRSDDGGRSWRGLPGQGDFYPASLSFADSRHGLMAASSSAYSVSDPDPVDTDLLLSTADGGRTWSPQFNDEKLHSVVLARSGRLGLAGLDGDSLLFTATGGEAPVHRRIAIHAGRPRAGAVRVTGRLTHARAGERVLISIRRPKQSKTRFVTVRSGRFALAVHGRATTTVVAQAVGDDRFSGAGSRAIRVRVGR